MKDTTTSMKNERTTLENQIRETLKNMTEDQKRLLLEYIKNGRKQAGT